MITNSKTLVWIEVILMMIVAAFGIWGVLKGTYMMLILVVAAGFVIFRQFVILQSLNQTNKEK